jgi:hypothetical protein
MMVFSQSNSLPILRRLVFLLLFFYTDLGIANPSNVLNELSKNIAASCINFIGNYRGICRDELNGYCKEQSCGTGEGFSDKYGLPTLLSVVVLGTAVCSVVGTLLLQKAVQLCRRQSTENVNGPESTRLNEVEGGADVGTTEV